MRGLQIVELVRLFRWNGRTSGETVVGELRREGRKAPVLGLFKKQPRCADSPLRREESSRS
jgi:hypothetical protein